MKLATTLRPRLRALPRWTHVLQPAAAGAAIGVIGIWYPQVMGAGYEHMGEAMHDQYAWTTLAVLAGLKMLSTVLSFASGTPGGLFAPTLFTGAMLGGAVCGIARMVAPEATGPILPSMEEQREAQPLRVEDAMHETTLALDGGMTVGDAYSVLEGARDGVVPVLLPGAVWAGVSARELELLHATGHALEPLQQALGPEARVATVHRDQPLETALRLIRNRPILPVVHREDRRRIEGVITLEEILRVYRDE